MYCFPQEVEEGSVPLLVVWDVVPAVPYPKNPIRRPQSEHFGGEG